MLSNGEKQKRRAIAIGLDEAFERASQQIESYDPERDRIVVFSDHHRGAGDKADDFRTNEHAYTAALGWYHERGYRLFLLGDVEELWEERPATVFSRYRGVLALEQQFATDGPRRFQRFWGNHDDLWNDQAAVDRQLSRAVGAPLTVREGLRMQVLRAGAQPLTLFFVHGHQGTTSSDRFGAISRLFVRHLWRPFQRLTGFSATTPASSHDLRESHDRAMFEWARANPGVVLLAGHTHRPVFGTATPPPAPTRPISDLEGALAAAHERRDAEAAAAVRAELEYARTAERRPVASFPLDPPCYFNGGCCSYPDGDVTGLELADGEIRLVRWPSNLHELRDGEAGIEPERRVLERASLGDILAAVADPAVAGWCKTELVGAAGP